MYSETLRCDLSFIHAHLSFLPTTIKRLEAKGLPFVEAFDIIRDVRHRLNGIPGEKKEILISKFDLVMDKNPGFKAMEAAASVLQGNNEVSVPDIFSPGDIANLRFCPVVSVDVERSFSAYKMLISDKRQNMKKENIQRIMVSHCYLNTEAEEHLLETQV